MKADIIHALLIEDSPGETRLFHEYLREAPGGDRYDVRFASTLEKGLTHLEEHPTGLVFLDLGLPDSRGLATYEAVRRAYPQVPVIILSGLRDEELALQAVQAGAQDYLFKSEVSGSVILRAARYAMERLKTKRERESTIEFLSLINTVTEKRRLMQSALGFFKRESGFAAVGIRLRCKDEYPYVATQGFKTDFVRTGNRLCARDCSGESIKDEKGDPVLECLCGNIIAGRIDPTLPFFTKFGSFWTNSTTRLLAGTAPADRQDRILDRCNSEGFESMALIPLRVNGKGFGLIQFNDTRTDLLSPEKILIWERWADYLSMTLSRFLAEEKLYQSEKQYRSLFENMLNGFFHCHMITQDGRPADFVFLDANRAFMKLTSCDNVTGKKATEVFPGIRETDPAVFELFRRVASSGRPEIAEIRITSLGRWWSISIYSPEKDYLVAVIDDITERKRAEKEIIGLARFPSENPAPVLRITSDGRLAYANQAAFKLIGGELETGKRVPGYLGEAAAAALESITEKSIEAVCQDRIFSITAVPFPDAEYVNLYGSDITEVKQAGVALHNLAVRFENLLAAVPEIVMEVNPEKVYLWANLAGLDFFGADVIGREAADFFVGEQATYETVQPLFNGAQESIELESWQRRRDGKIRLLAWRCRSIKDENGRITGTLSSARDITEEKEMQANIKALNARLEQRVEERTAQWKNANRELEAFSYSVSHDLRAPLRAIDGFTEILMEDYEASLDAEGKRICSVICENTRRMGQLIDDLLSFSRLGKTQISRSIIDMEKAARCAYEEAVPPEARPRIDFRIGSLPSIPGDLAMIRQVWANLISNAVKYSSRREQSTVSISGETAEGLAVFCVRDNGTGFDMRHADKLFGVFQRLHNRGDFEGTGVGLAIVKRIVERHNGRIWAESEPDKGAAFYFSLPLETNCVEGESNG